jgi:hypothetical protein
MKLAIVSLLLLSFFIISTSSQLVLESVIPGVITYYRNNTVPTSSSGLTATYALTNSSVYFTYVPCYGELTWYIGWGFQPTTTNYTYIFTWSSGGNVSFSLWSEVVICGG